MQFDFLTSEIVRIMFGFSLLLAVAIALIAAVRLAVVKILANVLVILENQRKIYEVIFESERKIDNILKTLGAYNDNEE